MRNLSFLVLFVLVFSSCKKEDDEMINWPGPVIDPLEDRIEEYPDHIPQSELSPEFRFVSNSVGFYLNGVNLYKTTDGGFNWSFYPNSITQNPTLQAIYFEDENKWMASVKNTAYNKSDIVFSEDGGQTHESHLIRKATSGFDAESVFRKDNLYFTKLTRVRGRQIFIAWVRSSNINFLRNVASTMPCRTATRSTTHTLATHFRFKCQLCRFHF